MNYLLSKLIKKRGINKEGLSKEEKVDFDRWEKILSEGEVSVEKIAEFCKAQIGLIEIQWKDLNNLNQKNERLIVAHTIYSTILKALTAPEVERANLEEYLTKLINE